MKILEDNGIFYLECTVFYKSRQLLRTFQSSNVSSRFIDQQSKETNFFPRPGSQLENFCLSSVSLIETVSKRNIEEGKQLKTSVAQVEF